MQPENLTTEEKSVEPSATTEVNLTPTPFIQKLMIEPDQLLQTVDDVGGGNFIHRYGGADGAFDPVSNLNIQTLKPKLARVSIDLDVWEPVNDDDNPQNFIQTGFKDEPGSIIHSTFVFLQGFQAMGEDQILIASVWYVPDWMVSNPTEASSRLIPPEMEAEVIESLAAWLIHARDQYGVEVDYISFNEANLGVNVLLTADHYAPLIVKAGKRFDELGLTTRWLLGDASSMKDTPSYAGAILSNPTILPYIGPLTFHSWDMTTSDETLNAIASLAEENNLGVWCTEGGWNPSLWQNPDDFPTFRNALNQAVVYTRVLKMTRATALLYWEMMGQDYSMNDGSQPYPILTFLDELKKQIPPGSKIVRTSADPQNLKFVAASKDESFVVLMVNRNPIKEFVSLEGLPNGRYQLIRSTKEGMNQVIGSYQVEDGTLNLEIAPSSINFLTTR